MCDRLGPQLSEVRSALLYEGWVRDAVIAFKYGAERARAEHLAKFMTPMLLAMPRPDLLVPVPMHRSRHRSRGYNQSFCLAVVLARVADVPLEQPLVRRIDTPQQVGLSAELRWRNVSEAFDLKRDADIRNRRVLMVDDVMTTGATLNACAMKLVAGGAAWVGAVTLARER